MRYTLVVILFLAVAIKSELKNYCVLEDGTTYKVVEQEKKSECLAYAEYDNLLEKTGWDQLYVSFEAKQGKLGSKLMEAAGFLEGYITADRITNHYANLLQQTFKGTIPDNVIDYLNNFTAYCNEMYEEKVVKKAANPDAEWNYWNAALGVHMQMKGMLDGYIAKSGKTDFRIVDLHVTASFGDLFEISQYKRSGEFPDLKSMNYEDYRSFIEDNSHCSAIIKVKEDLSDVWFAHNSWFTFAAMTRIFKEYEFPLEGSVAKKIIMSSYPSAVASIDDYFITDSDLVVIETSINVHNGELYGKLDPKSLLTSHRVMAANRLAKDAKEWTEIFAQNNSGTYNNQYMVVNMKLIDTTAKKIEDGAFYIIEQMPGATSTWDVTDYLRSGYWPSYNVPFSAYISDYSGLTGVLESDVTKRTLSDYSTSSRANIFRAKQGDVKTIEDVKKLMRYNNYKSDPLAKKDPCLTLACRADLRAVGPKCSGAYDAKVASINDIKGKADKVVHIISGPTREDGLEPINWTDGACKGVSNDGINKNANYDWIKFTSRNKKAIKFLE